MAAGGPGDRAAFFTPNFHPGPAERNTRGLSPAGDAMGRNDWKYVDYDGDDSDWAEERKEPPPQQQCGKCLHWVDRESLFCPWCGMEMGEGRRR